MPYRFLDHTGDTAVELSAPGEEELLEEARQALVDILIDSVEGATVSEKEEFPLELEAEDGESLLVDFLNELIFLFDSERLLCARVDWDEVVLDRPARLRGVLWGERFDPARHVSLTEVKAATFHGVRIHRRADGLRTTVVFDL